MRGGDVAAARRRVLGSSLSNAQFAGLVAQENMLGAPLRDNSRDDTSCKVHTRQAACFSRAFESPQGAGRLLFKDL